MTRRGGSIKGPGWSRDHPKLKKMDVRIFKDHPTLIWTLEASRRCPTHWSSSSWSRRFDWAGLVERKEKEWNEGFGNFGSGAAAEYGNDLGVEPRGVVWGKQDFEARDSHIASFKIMFWQVVESWSGWQRQTWFDVKWKLEVWNDITSKNHHQLVRTIIFQIVHLQIVQ
ncbi:hypothetical protein DVH24_029703 [Malus domestica]|uniref:Uncharacterized protein n=1 Tax=Malus domestica TaxID=3750 RepID=A0A498HYC7_MALDO|nr:hypothetical protein DVH24_029703 [Malus domestica]